MELSTARSTIRKLIRLRYCKTCELEKPPKASHCKFCNNCVKKFDHHCFFIGNCVGERNHRSFVVFLISGLIKSVYGLLCCFYSIGLVIDTNFEFFIAEFVRLKPFMVAMPIAAVLLLVAVRTQKQKLKSSLFATLLVYALALTIYVYKVSILEYYESLSLHLIVTILYVITLYMFYAHLRTQLVLIKMKVI